MSNMTFEHRSAETDPHAVGRTLLVEAGVGCYIENGWEKSSEDYLVSGKEELEKNLAAQIRILQKLRDLETTAGELLTEDDLDGFEGIQKEAESLVIEAYALQQTNAELAADLKRAAPAPTETLKKLDGMVRSLSKEVEKISKDNLDKYIAKARSLGRKLKHVHAGQNALATYKSQAHKSSLPPTFKKQT